jgi:acetolactate synthase-1/2/3 large subunit
VAEAWADSVPILLVTGQVNSDRMHFECGAYHEIDLESILRPVTKWCATVRHVAEVPDMVGEAFTAMTSGRPRPAALVLPQDLMAATEDPPHAAGLPSVVPLADESLPEAPPAAISEAAELLSSAERPIVLAGGGALWAGAAAEVRAVAERLNAPVITTLNGKGLIDERDPLSLGHARSDRARAALEHADAMLAVGCRFTEVMTGWRRMKVPRRLVQIDLAADQIGVNYPVALGIVAEARAALSALLKALPPPRSRGW